MFSEEEKWDDLPESFEAFSNDFNLSKKTRFPEKRIFIIFILVLLVFSGVSAVVGYQVGYRSVFGEGYETGYAEGNDVGYNEGLEIGKKDGYDIGYEEGGEAAQNDLFYGVYGMDGNSITTGAVSGDTVYCTASGTCYHREGCSYIAGKSGLKTMSESDAVASGYTPCSRCGK